MSDGTNAMAVGQNTLQQLDPDLYRRIKPHINDIVNELNKQEISESILYAVIDELITSVEQSEMMPFEETAVPAFGNMGPRQPFRPGPNCPPYRRNCRYPGNLSTDELIRLLLLRELGYL